ncbi:MAG: hypothetical protein C4K49_12045 [Candidatus Thorarchaeota archaeon]|nr:MAG: hypothetical protein C4K49_12045 [Candidatus Thorarchaeota archaeon]
MRTTDMIRSALVLGAVLLLVTSASFVTARADSPARGTDDDDTTTTTITEDDETTTTTDDDESEDEPHEERDSDGTAWIQTDIMTVKLDPETPTYQFWYTADGNGSRGRFMVSYKMIVEFDDLNGDGVYQPNETLGFVPLEAFEWTLQTGVVKNQLGQNEEVYASYTKGGLKQDGWDDDWFEDWMPGYEGPGEDDNESLSLADDEDEHQGNFTRFQDMTLQFYAHIYMKDYTGNVTDDEGVKANYTVFGGVELKVDIEIGNFPFQSGASKIAILNYIREDVASSSEYNYRFRLHEDDIEEEIESEDDSGNGTEVGEKFHDVEDDDSQGLSLVDGSTNVTRGFYRWVDKAVMTLNNGSEIAVDVGASFWTNGEALLLFFAYPNFDGGSLVHDPSMGVYEGHSPVDSGTPWLSNVLLLGVGAVAAVAIVVVIASKRRA